MKILNWTFVELILDFKIVILKCHLSLCPTPQQVARQDRVSLALLPPGVWGKQTDHILDYTAVRLSEFLIYSVCIMATYCTACKR